MVVPAFDLYLRETADEGCGAFVQHDRGLKFSQTRPAGVLKPAARLIGQEMIHTRSINLTCYGSEIIQDMFRPHLVVQSTP